MAKKKYQIPFDPNGNLVNYPFGDKCWDNKAGAYVPVIWQDNEEFYDELEYVDYSHGRSSVQMYFKSKINGRQYNMSLDDFSECIKKGLFKDNTIITEFTFAKRGTNFMLKPIFKEELI